MQERIILARLRARLILGGALIFAVVVGLWLLLRELKGDPNAALTALLGSAITALGAALGMIINAVSTPDKQEPAGGDTGPDTRE